MRPAVVRLVVSAFTAVLLLDAAIRASAEPEHPQQAITAGVTAVVVDAVVRDRRGNPVMDLRKDDFELFEDGVRQEITGLTLVRVGETPNGRPAGSSTAATPTATRTTPSFTAIVFDRLAPDVRAQVAQAAHQLVETLLEDDFAAVFTIDQSLRTVQPYTTDRAALRRALAAVAETGSAVFTLHPKTSADPEAALSNDGFQAAAIQAVRVGQATEDAWARMEGVQRGYATTGGLLAITRGLSLLPGRKSVAFFAHGVHVPDQVLHHYRQVIGEANRHNVSMYSLDASGLRVYSNAAEIGSRLGTVGPYGGGALGSGGVADAMRTPRTSLMLLAHETGGFFSENTNDLARAAARVAADRRFHYLLSYTPTNTNFDGKWRAVTLRVPARRGLEVRARSGYLATPAPTSVTFLEYEAPALAAFERSPAPADLPLRARAFAFPGGQENLVAVLAETDTSSLRFDRDAAANSYRADFTILARIVDEEGRVIRKSSEPYRLNGPIERLEGARSGTVLFFRQPVLEPGRYILEVALHDALADRSAVKRVAFTVMAPSGGLQVGSLLIVARAEPASSVAADESNPLRVGGVVIYPNLGEPIRKSREQALTFLVVMRSSTAVPSATLEIVREGQTVAQGQTPLSAAGASGLIEHIAQVPVGSLSPGHYMLRLTVGEGADREVRETAFEIAE